MNTNQLASTKGARPAGLAAAVLGFVLVTPLSQAQITLDAVVTLFPDAVRYDLTVHNPTSEDLVLISLLDGPMGDARIGTSLSAPPGFLGNYDPGLGIVDFLGDTEVFGAGSTLTGFGFETSPMAGLGFGTFEALGIQGTLYSGALNITVVPESGPVLATVVLLGGVVGHTLRRRRMTLSVR
jgi:hypothetical protein